MGKTPNEENDTLDEPENLGDTFQHRRTMKQEQLSVSLEKIKNAIAHRDLDFILSAFFTGRPPKLNDAFRMESECWDFKSGLSSYPRNRDFAGKLIATRK